jgi:RNA polymerase primary sigma factor
MVQDDINEMLHQLESRERDVLSYRFALGGCEKMTLKNISQKMGVSPETVRQIEMRAIKKMRGFGERLGLRV